MRSMIAGVLVIPICAQVQVVKPISAPKQVASQLRLQALVEDYYHLWLEMNPAWGTWSGVHRYDGLLVDFAHEVRAARVLRMKALLARCERIDVSRLSLPERLDLDLVRNGLLELRLDMEEIRDWERNPVLYVSAASEGVSRLISRDFAPAEVRLRLVLKRQRQFPGLLRSARTNLKNPPRIFTEMAIESIPELVAFFEHDVLQAFQGVRDRGLMDALTQANATTVAAFRKYETWLKGSLLPRSKGTAALGEALFRKKLAFAEQVNTSLDRLKEVGIADLRRNQADLKGLAQSMHPDAALKEVFSEVRRAHPPADRLFERMQERLLVARQFVERRDLLTIPATDLPIVKEMPPFLRATIQAQMNTVGPYERDGSSYLYLTPPDRSWPTDKVEQFLGYFNPGKLGNLAIHESFPGHFVMDSWLRSNPSMARRLCMSGTSIEGWATYAEQMMVEEGFAADDPMHRFGQLQDAVLRDARYLMSIDFHTRGRSLDEVRAFFQKEAFLPEPIAEMEAKRVASEPMVVTYTLGKLQFLKLREDLKQKEGSAFSLKRFHNAVLGSGILPVNLLRKALLVEGKEDL